MMNGNIWQDHSSHRSHRRTCVCTGVSRELQAVLTLVKMDLCLSLSPYFPQSGIGIGAVFPLAARSWWMRSCCTAVNGLSAFFPSPTLQFWNAEIGFGLTRRRWVFRLHCGELRPCLRSHSHTYAGSRWVKSSEWQLDMTARTEQQTAMISLAWCPWICDFPRSEFLDSFEYLYALVFKRKQLASC